MPIARYPETRKPGSPPQKIEGQDHVEHDDDDDAGADRPPVASPTACGPPATLKPYQQWISATASAKIRIFTTDKKTSRPWMNVEK